MSACKLGVHGYSGGTTLELVRHWYYALGFCSLRTLLFYANSRRRGFVLTPAQVLKYYDKVRSPEMELKGRMRRRALDVVEKASKRNIAAAASPQGESVAGGGSSRAQERAKRFPHKEWGWVVSADATGGFDPKAYGGIAWIHIFCDMATAGGYLRAVYQKPQVPAASAKALAEMVKHWEEHGHHTSRWGDPIDELRADSGGYTSSAVEEKCGDFCIKRKFSVPDTQAQNPVEAHIKLLFQRVTMMFAAAPHLPRFMWVYAIEHGIQCLNMAVHADADGPSWESFRSTELDFWAHPVLPFGQPVEVFVPADNRDWKFGDRSFTGWYVGSPERYKQGVYVFHPGTGKVRVTRDYVILPSEPRAEWNLYIGKGRAANTFVPMQLPPGAQQHIDLPDANEMGGDPTALPPDLDGAIAPSFQDDLLQEEAPLLASNDPFTTPSRAAADAVAAREDIVDGGLVPVELSQQQRVDDEQRYNLEEVEPVQLSMDRIHVSSIGRDGQTLEGAHLRYTLTPEEVDGDSDSVQDTEGSAHDVERAELAHAVLKLRVHEMRIKRKGPTVLDKLNKLRDASREKRTKGKKTRTADNPTLSNAMRGPYRQMVIDAIDAELTQYVETYQAIRLFDDKQRSALSSQQVRAAISSHYEITYKRDKATGELVRVKARLCIHGNETEKYDFDDVKSPTARTASLKIVLALYAKTYKGKRFKGRTWDITGAFLRTKISDRNSVKQSKDPDFVAPEPILLRLPDGRIGEVQSYVYGLKQASLEFRDSVDELLRKHGYLLTADPCIYVKDVGDDKIIISSHVDDFLAVSTSDKMLDDLGRVLAESYGVGITGNGGDKLEYMGLVISRTDDGSVFVSQPGFYKKLWKEYAEDFDLTARDLEKELPRFPMHATNAVLEGDDEEIDGTWYKGIIGAMNYLALMTRPDMSFALSVLASKCQCPTYGDYRKVRHLFKFAMGTAHMGINFRNDDDFQLCVYADASYASREDCRSQNGYCMALGAGNAAFYCKSSKQQLVTLSSTEAEYVAMFHSATEVVFLKRLVQQMGFVQEPVTVFQDNESAIRWAHGQENFHRAKHLQVKYHYVRELVREKVIAVEYLSTKEMVADVLTKPLVSEQFQYLASMMLGVFSFHKRTASESYSGVSVTT